jgi:hypothetical protein
MTKRLLVGLLFGVSLLMFVLPGLAQPGRESDPLVKLEKAGWKIVQDGVLQRQAKPGQVETFVFGVEGFTWKLRDLGSQLAFLRAQFQANPTPELRRAIANHRKVIASTLETLERAEAAEARGETILPKTDCTIDFAYNADASYKTDSKGVWAEATADFNVAPGCDFSGEVYTYAFAQTTVSGASTTATVTDGPRTGSNINASAYADRNGVAPCESYAFSSVTSNDLNPSSYSISMSNELCRPLLIGGPNSHRCPVCTTLADGSYCCDNCWCDGFGQPVVCNYTC